MIEAQHSLIEINVSHCIMSFFSAKGKNDIDGFIDHRPDKSNDCIRMDSTCFDEIYQIVFQTIDDRNY